MRLPKTYQGTFELMSYRHNGTIEAVLTLTDTCTVEHATAVMFAMLQDRNCLVQLRTIIELDPPAEP